MNVYTAHYSYSGSDRLDITAKGNDPKGKIFAPTWKMVMQSKQGLLQWEDYKFAYKDRMRKSYKMYTSIWLDVLGRDEITLVCFCNSGSNCHRYLLAEYFTAFGAVYRGERE